MQLPRDFGWRTAHTTGSLAVAAGLPSGRRNNSSNSKHYCTHTGTRTYVPGPGFSAAACSDPGPRYKLHVSQNRSLVPNLVLLGDAGRGPSSPPVASMTADSAGSSAPSPSPLLVDAARTTVGEVVW